MAGDNKDVKLYRYWLPSEKYGGWAEIVLGSNGFFAAVSDYGNYSYIWGAHGKDDFRKFILDMERDWDYFGNKLNHDKMNETDTTATARNIQSVLEEMRMCGDLDDEQAEEENRLAEDLENGNISLDIWFREQRAFDDPYTAGSHVVTRVCSDLEAFCKKTLPRLCVMIRSEMDAENSAQK